MLGSKNKRLLILVAFLGLTASRVRGQSAASIESLEVALWPEYDRQAVLVIYRFRLSPGSLAPTTVEVPIPTAVGQPHAVAWRDSEGGLLVAEYTRIVEDDRARMLITMHSLEGQLEFYENLTVEGTRRSFLFSWPGGVEVGDFSYQVQQPVGALGLEIAPPPDRRTVGQDGFTYQWVDVGHLQAEDRPAIELRYEKETAALSAETLEPIRPPTSGPAVQPAADNDSLPLWLLGSFGGVLLGLVVSWYWWSARRPNEEVSASTRRSSAATKKPPTKDTGRAGASFCHNCGAKAVTSATYCMSCGTRLHR